MVDVVFYEKPGCSGNARQKKLLAAAGHSVTARDLRLEPWSCHKLLGFFAGLPIPQWFNGNAPAIKSGAIVPEELDEPTALALMIDEPLLIRRPLLQVGDERRVGFEAAAIHAWIGLGERPPGDDLEACRHPEGHRCAEEPVPAFLPRGGEPMPCQDS